MIEVIEILRKNNFYGAGKYTEIAKGKFELIYTFKEMKRKLKRIRYDRKRN